MPGDPRLFLSPVYPLPCLTGGRPEWGASKWMAKGGNVERYGSLREECGLQEGMGRSGGISWRSLNPSIGPLGSVAHYLF